MIWYSGNGRKVGLCTASASRQLLDAPVCTCLLDIRQFLETVSSFHLMQLPFVLRWSIIHDETAASVAGKKESGRNCYFVVQLVN